MMLLMVVTVRIVKVELRLQVFLYVEFCELSESEEVCLLRIFSLILQLLFDGAS